VVHDLDPGQERFVELRQSGHGRKREFGQKIGLDETEETLDFSATFRVVGSAKDALDAQSGADGVHMLGGVDLTPVDVDGQGTAIAQDGALETILHARKLFVPIKLRVRDEARVIVKKGKEKGLSLMFGIRGIGKIGAVHRVALPEIAKVETLKAAIGLGALLGAQPNGGGASEGELAAQGAGSDVGFRDWIGVIEFEQLDDGSRGAVGLLALERLGPVESFWGDGAGLFPVGARVRLETVKAFQAIETFPASESGDADGAARRVGDLVAASSDFLPQLLFAAWWVLAAQQGQDEGVAKERDLGQSILGIGHGTASFLILMAPV
jgi:hypothetical protein